MNQIYNNSTCKCNNNRTMQITRGTTPTILINIKDSLDMDTIQQVWVYISQQNKVKVDKQIADVQIDTEKKQISVKLTQEDTLALKAGEGFFQIRVLLNDGTALATVANKILVVEIYKDGVMS